jgi:predicted dehydrogenase
MDLVRIGVIGVGGMGGFHVRSLKEGLDGAVLAAVGDVDGQKLGKLTQQYQVPGFETSDKLIDSGLVDAVIIATPHYFHPPIAQAAFARGLHVLSEKPIGVLMGPVRALNELYQKKYADKLKFAIMFQQRTSAMYRKLRELIADGELGEISRVTWLITDWFRPWAYYASGGWRATWDGEGGGVLINQCPHNLDLIQWITGMMPTRVTAVAAIGKKHPIEVEDDASAILEYANGAVGHFVTTTGEAPGTNRLEICGDRGKIVAEEGKLLFARTRKSVREINEKSHESFPHVETWDVEEPYRKGAPEGHKVVTQNFIRAILKGEELIAPAVEGVKGLEIGAAIQMSGLTRQPVDLPINSAAHQKFIDEMRKKYGGKKSLATKEAVVNMEASFH